jgi:cytochrome bd-type quinol oxidase subunit 2
MRGWLPLVVGVIAILIGVVWTLQGLGYLAGSVMTGERIWAVIGPLLAVVGLGLIVFAARARRRSTRSD